MTLLYKRLRRRIVVYYRDRYIRDQFLTTKELERSRSWRAQDCEPRAYKWGLGAVPPSHRTSSPPHPHHHEISAL